MPSASVEVAQPVVTDHDARACRESLRVGSRSFHAAAFLLPRSFREPAAALYAFCRTADDAVDDSQRPERDLQRMHRRLDAIYAGIPGSAAEDRAMADVVRQHDLPKALLEALFEGFAWDVEGRRYPTASSLYDYAARVAGSVGVMMAVLMDVRRPDLLARAADLGVAMQLTNIARDVGEDARAGRLYLPLEWLHEEGIDPEAFLRDPRFSPGLARITGRLLEHAETLYRRADSGIAGLPGRCRPAIHAARLLYAEIGREVARQGYDSVSQRAVVSGGRKLRLLSARLPGCARAGAPLLGEPVLDETAFLVTSATREDAVPGGDASLLGRVERKYVWVLDLFEQMERRDRMRAQQRLLDETAA
jgi:15-cis-phytoene synthase